MKTRSRSLRNTTPATTVTKADPLPAGLYIVATPIGNLRDITLRALDILAAADAVLCEDTRVSARLLTHYGVSRPLIAYHEHNAARMRPRILDILGEGKALALISDAGTPLVSDPGYKLVREVAAAGNSVFAVPGASSITAALAVGGLPTDRFLFLGFLPPKSAGRRRALQEVAAVEATLVILEAPPRLLASLTDLAEVLGNRPAAIARELTKLHEEVRRASLADLAAHYATAGAPKGEIVILVAPPPDAGRPATTDAVDAALMAALAAGTPVKLAASTVASRHGVPRREAYARALALKAEPRS